MEWISVEDRLPDTRHIMLVCTRNRNNVPKIAMAYFENGFGWCGSGGRWNNVTHWMPLPELPQGKPEECRYYTIRTYDRQGGCLGTKEIDPCQGPSCPHWKPKKGTT